MPHHPMNTHGDADSGGLYMSFVPGKTLKSAWAEFDDTSKGHILPGDLGSYDPDLHNPPS
jgi:hypothetical protein